MFLDPLASSSPPRTPGIPRALASAVALLATAHCVHAGDVAVRPDFTVRASDPQPYDAFGYGLAADGNALLVGARGSDSTALNGGAIYAHAHLVTPAGPELYAHIGPWYAAALEGIWDLIGKAARWHQERTK